VRLNFYS